MEPHGFVHGMLDSKCLILFILDRALYPVDAQKIYELCLQDDCVNYFDILQALPQMVETGHLKVDEKNRYEITEKGRETNAITADEIAYPVMLRAKDAVERFNREIRRSNFVKTEILARKDDEYAVLMGLDDDISSLLSLELMAPSLKQARVLSKAFEKKAERVYQAIMEILLEDEKKEDL
ncbi:MAG: DUF4364 family protein [Clostridia bacterium]|nr:DUF4364 family protein [Clostridia bacterium]